MLGAVGGWAGGGGRGQLEAAVGVCGCGASEGSAEQKPRDWPAGQRSRGEGMRWPAGAAGQAGGVSGDGVGGTGTSWGLGTCKETWGRDVAVGDQPPRRGLYLLGCEP